MLQPKQLERVRITYQSNDTNVYREYTQHLFLSFFYRKPGSEKILFKGGTALRFVYKSPRFSEDLDFSARSINQREVENILSDVLVDFSQSGFNCKLTEAKPTMGGYLTDFEVAVHHLKVRVAIQISSRKKVDRDCQTLSIENEYIPTYTAKILSLSELTNEKVQAALTRGKPRDFYDLYFLLRSNLFPKERIKDLPTIRQKVEEKEINFKKEMSLFLPSSMTPLIKSFPAPLFREIEKFS